jgi:Asp-tRNA(Asn)/Glu-tRNA(Gln) amidotransferase A subunit family amidase
VQINFALGQTLSGFDYAHARRHRSALTAAFLETMSHVDVIATPTTGCTAPLMPEHALPNGESNLPQLERISRFSALANLSGFPAIALPAGHNQAGLPVSCQFMGRPWSEALLFRVGRVAEDCVERTVPRAHVDLLG